VSPVTAARDLRVYISTRRRHHEDPSHQHRQSVFCSTAALQIRSVRRSLPQHALLTLIRTLVITKLDQCNSVLVGRLCIPAGPTAVRAECRRSACLLAPDVRTHNSIATGASLVARPGTNPVPVVCSGVPLCAWHSIGVYLCDSLRPTSEIVGRRCLHYKCRRLVGLPSATAPFRWLQRVHGTVCH